MCYLFSYALLLSRQSCFLLTSLIPAKSELRFAAELEESSREITLIHTKIRNTYWISHDWDSVWNTGEQNTLMQQVFLNNASDLKKMVFHQIIVDKRKTVKLFLTLDALLPIRRAVVCTHPGVWQENKQILQNTTTTKLISAWCSKVTYFWINSTSYGRTNSHPMATFIRDICKTN